MTRARVAAQRPEEQPVRDADDGDRIGSGPRAEPAIGPRKIEQLPANRGETSDDPARQTEQAHFFARRRLDAQAIGIAGASLLFDDPDVCPRAPDRGLP